MVWRVQEWHHGHSDWTNHLHCTTYSYTLQSSPSADQQTSHWTPVDTALTKLLVSTLCYTSANTNDNFYDVLWNRRVKNQTNPDHLLTSGVLTCIIKSFLCVGRLDLLLSEDWQCILSMCMHVCVSDYVCVCAYVCLHLLVCVCVYLCMHTCAYLVLETSSVTLRIDCCTQSLCWSNSCSLRDSSSSSSFSDTRRSEISRELQPGPAPLKNAMDLHYVQTESSIMCRQNVVALHYVQTECCGSSLCAVKMLWLFIMCRLNVVALHYVQSKCCGSSLCADWMLWLFIMCSQNVVALHYLQSKCCRSSLCAVKTLWILLCANKMLLIFIMCKQNVV